MSFPAGDTKDGGTSEECAVTVSVRLRPLNKRELDGGCVQPAWHWAGPSIVSLQKMSQEGASASKHTFTFDNVFPPETETQEVYDSVCKSVVESAVRGYNCCVFAYGQTSTGKTHTMHGSDSTPGVIPRGVQDVFRLIAETPEREFMLRVSYMEIYNESVNDLLNPAGKNLSIYEHPKKGVFVNGLAEELVISAEEVAARIKAGEEQRHVAYTNFNAVSSRSHTVFRVVIESKAVSKTMVAASGGGSTPATKPRLLVPDSRRKGRGVRSSTLNLVDLAGSENVRATGAKGQRRKEGGFINKSLLTLGHVISRLSAISRSDKKRGPGHIPYRDSKLTRILQPALSANSRLAVICTITMAESSLEETQNTLKFGSRAKRIKHVAIVNEVADAEAVIQQYKNEVARLKEKLRMYEEAAQHRVPAIDTGGDTSAPLFSLYAPKPPTPATSPGTTGAGAGAGAGAGTFPSVGAELRPKEAAAVYRPFVTRNDGALAPLAAVDQDQDVSVLQDAIANLSKLILNSKTPAKKKLGRARAKIGAMGALSARKTSRPHPVAAQASPNRRRLTSPAVPAMSGGAGGGRHHSVDAGVGDVPTSTPTGHTGNANGAATPDGGGALTATVPNGVDDGDCGEGGGVGGDRRVGGATKTPNEHASLTSPRSGVTYGSGKSWHENTTSLLDALQAAAQGSGKVPASAGTRDGGGSRVEGADSNGAPLSPPSPSRRGRQDSHGSGSSALSSPNKASRELMRNTARSLRDSLDTVLHHAHSARAWAGDSRSPAASSAGSLSPMQRRRRSNSVSLTDLDLSQVTSEEEVSDDDDRIGSLVDGEVADYAQELAKIREQLDQLVRLKSRVRAEPAVAWSASGDGGSDTSPRASRATSIGGAAPGASPSFSPASGLSGLPEQVPPPLDLNGSQTAALTGQVSALKAKLAALQKEYVAQTLNYNVKVADSLFLQQQLEEKEKSLQEWTDVLLSLEDRHNEVLAERDRLAARISELVGGGDLPDESGEGATPDEHGGGNHGADESLHAENHRLKNELATARASNLKLRKDVAQQKRALEQLRKKYVSTIKAAKDGARAQKTARSSPRAVSSRRVRRHSPSRVTVSKLPAAPGVSIDSQPDLAPSVASPPAERSPEPMRSGIVAPATSLRSPSKRAGAATSGAPRTSPRSLRARALLAARPRAQAGIGAQRLSRPASSR